VPHYLRFANGRFDGMRTGTHIHDWFYVITLSSYTSNILQTISLMYACHDTIAGELAVDTSLLARAKYWRLRIQMSPCHAHRQAQNVLQCLASVAQ